MSREGSQTQEGRKGEGQVEGRREANTAEEEADATGDRTGPSHRLGRPHEPDELVEGARLKRIELVCRLLLEKKKKRICVRDLSVKSISLPAGSARPVKVSSWSRLR